MASSAKSAALPVVGTSTGGRKATGARNSRRKVRGPWTDDSDRFAQALVLASRIGGGGDVQIERPDGTKGTIVVKQSRDCPAPLVDQTRELRLQAVSFQQERQQEWHDKQQAACPSKEGHEQPPETSRTRKRREKRQQQRKDAAELKVLKQAAAEQATAAAAEAQRQAWEGGDGVSEGMLRQALGQISQLTIDCANQAPDRSVVLRNAVLEQQGEPTPVKVLSGSVGLAMDDDELGKAIVDALVGYPDEQLAGRFASLVAILSASTPAKQAASSTQTQATSAAADVSMVVTGG